MQELTTLLHIATGQSDCETGAHCWQIQCAQGVMMNVAFRRWQTRHVVATPDSAASLGALSGEPLALVLPFGALAGSLRHSLMNGGAADLVRSSRGLGVDSCVCGRERSEMKLDDGRCTVSALCGCCVELVRFGD